MKGGRQELHQTGSISRSKPMCSPLARRGSPYKNQQHSSVQESFCSLCESYRESAKLSCSLASLRRIVRRLSSNKNNGMRNDVQFKVHKAFCE